jgi:hypothetical protein
MTKFLRSAYDANYFKCGTSIRYTETAVMLHVAARRLGGRVSDGVDIVSCVVM